MLVDRLKTADFVCMMSFAGHGSEVNLRGIRASSSSSNIRSEGNNFDTVSYKRKTYFSDCFFKCLFIVDNFLFILLSRILNTRYY
jgi:hypothetical protein